MNMPHNETLDLTHIVFLLIKQPYMYICIITVYTCYATVIATTSQSHTRNIATFTRETNLYCQCVHGGDLEV